MAAIVVATLAIKPDRRHIAILEAEVIGDVVFGQADEGSGQDGAGSPMISPEPVVLTEGGSGDDNSPEISPEPEVTGRSEAKHREDAATLQPLHANTLAKDTKVHSAPVAPRSRVIRAWVHNCTHRLSRADLGSPTGSQDAHVTTQRLTCMANGAVARGEQIVSATAPCGWYSSEAATTNECAARALIEDIQSDKIGPQQLQVVLNRYTEDISWSDEFDKIRVVYDKGKAPLNAKQASNVFRLANVGREAHTYLTHIVRNYDTLADRTVFLHAEEPGCGFFMGDGKSTGNHLLANVSVVDYMTSNEHVFAPLTMAFDRTLSTCSTRLGFADVPLHSSSLVHYDVSFGTRPVPLQAPTNEWMEWELNPYAKWLNETKGAASRDLYMWPRVYNFVLDTNDPPPDVLYYAQGAQFSATREAIRRVPLAHYQKLLDYVSNPKQPRTAFPYMIELLWPTLLGMKMPSPESPYAVPNPPISLGGLPSLGESWLGWHDADRPPACANELHLEVEAGDLYSEPDTRKRAQVQLLAPERAAGRLLLRDYGETQWQTHNFEKPIDAELLMDMIVRNDMGWWTTQNIAEVQKHLDGDGVVAVEWDASGTPIMSLVAPA